MISQGIIKSYTAPVVLQQLYSDLVDIADPHSDKGVLGVRGDVKIPPSLTTDFSPKFTEPPKGISYPIDDLCSPFTILTGPFDYTLHINLIAPGLMTLNTAAMLVSH